MSTPCDPVVAPGEQAADSRASARTALRRASICLGTSIGALPLLWGT
jgi:hypothetical protein